MAALKTSSYLALFVGLNLLFFSLVRACGSCSNPNPTPNNPINPNPNPNPNPRPSPATPAPSTGAKCPRDALKLGVCANLLGLINLTIGSPPVTPCCTLIQGLADLEAAACLCTAIKANVLGINLNVPVSLTLLLNVCSKNVPSDFQCA